MVVRRLLVITALAVLLGTGLVEAKMHEGNAVNPLPMSPGDEFVYEVEYFAINTGHARLVVEQPRTVGGRTLYPISGYATTNRFFSRIFRVRDKLTSYWDPVERRSVGMRIWAEEGKVHRFTEAVVDHESGRVEVTIREKGKAPEVKRLEVEPGSYDAFSAFFALRGFPLRVGDTITMPLYTAKRATEIQFTVLGRERVKTDLGSFDCVVVAPSGGLDGKLESKGDWRIWFTEDRYHIPIKMESELVLGKLRAEIVRVEGPRRRLLGD